MKSNFKAEIEHFSEMMKNKMAITSFILFGKNDVSEVADMVSFFTKDKAFAAFNQCYANYVCLCSVLPKNGECGCGISILKEK